tara:strand:- start:2577 stop:3521 length:945 start_codon:yes stop_codon:yes gene_type:complete
MGIHLLGDVDKDGQITINDATKILLYNLGYTTLDEEQMVIADVDQNGSVTVNDATKILLYLLGYDPNGAIANGATVAFEPEPEPEPELMHPEPEPQPEPQPEPEPEPEPQPEPEPEPEPQPEPQPEPEPEPEPQPEPEPEPEPQPEPEPVDYAVVKLKLQMNSSTGLIKLIGENDIIIEGYKLKIIQIDFDTTNPGVINNNSYEWLNNSFNGQSNWVLNDGAFSNGAISSNNVSYIANHLSDATTIDVKGGQLDILQINDENNSGRPLLSTMSNLTQIVVYNSNWTSSEPSYMKNITYRLNPYQNEFQLNIENI